MTLIHTVAPENASGDVAAIYAEMNETIGFVPNALSLRSASPALLGIQWQGMSYYMQHPTLSPELLACVRMLIIKIANRTVGERK